MTKPQGWHGYLVTLRARITGQVVSPPRGSKSKHSDPLSTNIHMYHVGIALFTLLHHLMSVTKRGPDWKKACVDVTEVHEE